MRTRLLAAGTAVLVGALVLAGCSGGRGDGPEAPATPTVSGATAPAEPDGPPNVVLVLMDDASVDLLRTMPAAREMERRGATYPNTFAVDSMCCVSRASLLTGQYPHQTGVLTNISGTTRLGGWPAFVDGGNLDRSVNVALSEAGWSTGFVGKYLNEYEWNPGWAVPPEPPGWTQFQALFGSAYGGWGFARTQVGRDGSFGVVEHPAPPASASDEEKDRAYAGTVTHDLAMKFVRRHEKRDQPYFLEVATYAPHSRVNPGPYYPGDPLFPAAFADRPGPGRPGNCGAVACADLGIRDLPGHGDPVDDNVPLTEDGRQARAWNTSGPGRTRDHVDQLRQRAMMVQSVDRMLADLLDAVGDDTYVVLTSDNGFHLGQVGMAHGKGTAYDTDSRVPLLVVGPGVVPGERGTMVSTLDLAPTLLELAGEKPEAYRAGTSLVPTFADPEAVTSTHVFLEHTQQTLSTGDPDAAFSGAELDRIPTYTAVRSRTGLLVRLDLDPSAGGVRRGYEFYSYDEVPWERTNQFADPAYADEVADLMGRLRAFDRCSQRSGDARFGARCRALTAPAG